MRDFIPTHGGTDETISRGAHTSVRHSESRDPLASLFGWSYACGRGPRDQLVVTPLVHTPVQSRKSVSRIMNKKKRGKKRKKYIHSRTQTTGTERHRQNLVCTLSGQMSLACQRRELFDQLPLPTPLPTLLKEISERWWGLETKKITDILVTGLFFNGIPRRGDHEDDLISFFLPFDNHRIEEIIFHF